MNSLYNISKEDIELQKVGGSYKITFNNYIDGYMLFYSSTDSNSMKKLDELCMKLNGFFNIWIFDISIVPRLFLILERQIIYIPKIYRVCCGIICEETTIEDISTKSKIF